MKHIISKSMPAILLLAACFMTSSIVASSSVERRVLAGGLTATDNSLDQSATVSMAYNQYIDELDIVYAMLNESTDRREVWFKSIRQGNAQSSQIGFCYRYSCPVSIAVSPETHLPAVAYRDEGRNLVFAQLTNDTWITETVFTQGWNGSLAFDPTDNGPAIAFNSTGDYNLYYAKQNGSGWSTSILSWLDAEFESLRFHPVTNVRYISFKTFGWSYHPSRLYHFGPPSGFVDGDPEYVGGGNALAFDQAGYSHITYIDHTNGRLRHAWWDGTMWNIEVIDDLVHDDSITSLAISDDGEIYVSYTKSGQRELNLAYFDGNVWRKQAIAKSDQGDISTWSSVVIDDQDQAHIAFVTGGEVQVVTVGAAPTGLTVDGPTLGTAGSCYSFTATITPFTARSPFTYTWQATGQSDVVTSTYALSHSVSFTWSVAGIQAINVTATNAVGTITDTAFITIYVPPTSVDISGPTTGKINTAYVFTATVNPPTATLPIMYTWQATGQSDVVTSTYALSHTATFTWNTPGTQLITVTAANGVGVVTQTHTISTAFSSKIHLPLVSRRWPPIPYPPALDPVGEVLCGNYTVSWTKPPQCLTDTCTYTLQEATDPAFNINLRQVCTTPDQHCNVYDKPAGTYYYRVRGWNTWGYGEWSNVESARVLPLCLDPAGFDRRPDWSDFYEDLRYVYIPCLGSPGGHGVDLSDYILEMTFQGGDGRCAQLYFKDPNWANVYSKCRSITSGAPIRFDPIHDPCDVREFTDFTRIYAIGAKIREGIQGVTLVSACLVRR